MERFWYAYLPFVPGPNLVLLEVNMRQFLLAFFIAVSFFIAFTEAATAQDTASQNTAKAGGTATAIKHVDPIRDMKLNEWGQLVAWLAAAVFFAYKVLSGYLISDVSIKLACERKHKSAELDYLALTVTLKKGERGGIVIHDGQARVRGLTVNSPQELIGVRRLDRPDPAEIARIKWEELRRGLNLPPGDEMQFAALFEVPCGQSAVVEVVVLAKKLWRPTHKFGQWRASYVSLPHEVRP